MPAMFVAPVAVLNPGQPYDRLAFRCSLSVDLVGDVPQPGGSVALHATRYRKPEAGVIEVCGRPSEESRCVSARCEVAPKENGPVECPARRKK